MATRLDEEAEFWLPADFLTDEDIIMGSKEYLNNTKVDNFFGTNHAQVVNFSNVEHHLAELTRQLSLHKSDRIATHQNYQRGNFGMVGSPQSTLLQYGGYSGQSPVSSNGGSPTSHFSPAGNPDLIHQAAQQVAKLKMEHALNNSVLYNAFAQRVREEQILKHHQQQRGNAWSNHQSNDVIFRQNGFSGVNDGAYMEKDETVWPSLQFMMQQNQHKRSSGAANGQFCNVKKPSAGTGVFIPRRCVNETNGGFEPRKNKMTGCSTTSLRGMGERINPHVNVEGQSHPQWQSRRGVGLCSDYELQLAQTKVRLMHERSSHLHQQVALSHELGLPQEWTY